MAKTGWIFLHRKFLQWEWYDDINTKVVFLHCLLKANWKEKQWRGETIKRGSFITSLHNLSSETGLSVQNIRTCLSKLESTGEINKRSTSVNTLITVINYNDYQDANKVLTNDQQTTNKRLTTTKEYKESKEGKEVYPFDDFWDDYDKKVGRAKCEKKWKSLPKKDKEMIKEFIPAYKEHQPDKKYRKHPYTFLNYELWKDDISDYKNNGKADFDFRRYY